MEERVGLNIRHATEEDYEALCVLYAEGDAFHAAGAPDVYHRVAGPARTREEVREALDDGIVLIAEANREAVGLVHAQLKHVPDHPVLVPRTYAVVDSLAVKKEFRRLGIATRLMAAVESWACEQGATSIELHVHGFNKGAVALYGGLGYGVAALRMRKRLR